jgi:myo-inositol-1(or 4)-monophosphatase
MSHPNPIARTPGYLDNCETELSQIATSVEKLLREFDLQASRKQSILHYGDNVQTTLDRDIDAYLQRRLRTILDVAIVSEERDLERAEFTDYFWVVDPVDGTINAISGSADWAISVALVEAKSMRSAVGIVYILPRQEMFAAVSGLGARLNGTRLRVTAPQRNAMGYSTPIVSFGVPANISAVSGKMGKVLTSIMEQGWVTRQTGSAAVDICRVARGSWSAFFEYNLMYWDVAAAVLIAQEAGCRIALQQPRARTKRSSILEPRDVLVAAPNSIGTQLTQMTDIPGL